MDAKELSLKWLPLAWMSSLFTSLTFMALRGFGVDPRNMAFTLGTSSVFAFAMLIYGIWTLAAMALLFLLLRRKDIGLASVGLQGSLSLKGVGYAVVGAAVAISLWPPVEALVRTLGGSMFWRSENPPWTMNTPMDGLLLFILPVAVVPVLEEVLYRGYVLTMLSQRTGGTLISLILSCLIFASVHVAFGPGSMAYIFIWAFIPSLLYLRFKNLYPAMLMHSLNNLWAYVGVPLLLAKA